MKIPSYFWAAGAALIASSALTAAEPPPVVHYYDEVGQRYLTLTTSQGGVTSLALRHAYDPGSSGMWLGQGIRKEEGLSFAAQVEEGQDRGPAYLAKGEAKLEVLFRPGQNAPQDYAGVLGIYRRITDDRRLLLVRKEFQAAEARLEAAWKSAAKSWLAEDRPVISEWKGRWPQLRQRVMNFAYDVAAPSTPVKPALGAPKGKTGPEADPDYWLKLAQTTNRAYAFCEQTMTDIKGQGAWVGVYDDGFGGSVVIRRLRDGRLQVSLACTRGNEVQGTDFQGVFPASSVKDAGKAGAPAVAEQVFTDNEMPEGTRDLRISLKRKGGYLWVDVTRPQQQNAAEIKRPWFDGIYRWTSAITD